MAKKISSLNELETHFDSLFDSLRIYQWPVREALWFTLAASQFHAITSLPHSAPELANQFINIEMRALELLIPQLYKMCAPWSVEGSPDERHDEIMNDAIQALEYCRRYQSVSVAFTLFHQNVYSADLTDRTISFAYPSPEILRFALLSRFLRLRLESEIAQNSTTVGSLEILNQSAIHEDIGHSISAKGNVGLEAVSQETRLAFRSVIESETMAPSLPLNLNCGSYSIGQAYDVWLELKALALMRGMAVMYSVENLTSERMMNVSLLSCSIEELSKYLTAGRSISFSIVRSVLEDLVFDPDSIRPDAVIRPLYPLPSSDQIVAAPFLISNANWETCLLRNLGRSPGMYGGTIAPQKEKLSDQLAQEFRNRGFQAVSRKKVQDQAGRLVGDVDVAVLDRNGNRLALIEVKWLIPPDSPHEVVQANREIDEGRIQVERISKRILEEPTILAAKLFQNVGEIDQNLKLDMFVVSKGFLGLLPMAEEPLVLDYDLVVETLQAAKSSLATIWTKVVEAHDKIAPPENLATTAKISIGGYLLEIPAFAMSLPTERYQRPKIGRNQPCQCGSGVKLKRCCIGLVDVT